MPKKNNLTPEGIRRGHLKGKQTQRQQYLQRVAARLKQEVAPLTGSVPEQDLLTVAARIYAKAYTLGYHCGINRSNRRMLQ